MKLLFYSSTFYPNIGGIETITEVLGREFVTNGLEVKVLTNTIQIKGDKKFEFDVIDNTSIPHIFQLVKWADVVLCQCISLKFIWIPLLLKKKTVVVHQTWYARSLTGKKGPQDYLKLILCRYVKNIAISKSIAQKLFFPSIVINNPINAQLFLDYQKEKKNKSIVFVGRLVSDKGCALLLDAMHKLIEKHHQIDLTIIGDGPERSLLVDTVFKKGLEQYVTFTGALKGIELAKEVANHRIMVVPSLWDEPYGIVAIEGLAAGCILVGSSGGGLGEIVEDIGFSFPNGDVEGLVSSLDEALAFKWSEKINHAKRIEMVNRHTPFYIANQYLKILMES